MVVTFDLPMPPSVNALYGNSFNRTGKGRYPMPAYKAWVAHASAELNRQKVPTVRGQYSISMTFERKDKRRRDCFNFEKAIGDLLVSQGVVEDDSLCDDGRVCWDKSGSIRGVRVELRSI